MALFFDIDLSLPAKTGIFLLICVLAVSCSEKIKPQEEAYLKPIRDSFSTDINRDIVFGMNGKILENNKLVMTYNSPLVFTRQRQDSSFIEFVGGIKGYFYGSKSSTNERTGYMESSYAVYYRQLKKMYLKGNVKIINQKNDLLRSDDLWWDQKEKKVHTDGRVSFVQGGSKLYGIGFTSNEDMTEYEVKQLTGEIKGL